MSFQTGSIDKNGLARTEDGKLYVTSVGTASITGGSGAFDTLSLNGKGAITSGTYTPTLTNTTNVAASTAFTTNYFRIGNLVHVAGVVNIDPTASVATVLEISLPIASNLNGPGELAGTAVTAAAAGYSAAISPNTTNETASLQFVCGADLANRSWYFNFTYQIN
jgi:hypothetical protein